jgi:hypothetical protein
LAIVAESSHLEPHVTQIERGGETLVRVPRADNVHRREHLNNVHQEKALHLSNLNLLSKAVVMAEPSPFMERDDSISSQNPHNVEAKKPKNRRPASMRRGPVQSHSLTKPQIQLSVSNGSKHGSKSLWTHHKGRC